MTILKDTPVVASLASYQDAAWATEHFDYPYQMYALTTHFDDGFSVVPQPLAGGDGTQVAHIKLQSAFTLVTVAWAGMRAGEHPAAPNPSPPAGSNFVLLRRRISPEAPRFLPDGKTRVYAISGVYEYSLTNPTVGVGGLPMGSMPFDATPAVLYFYTAEDFRTSIFPLG